MTWRRTVAVGGFVADSDGSDFRVSTLTGWDGGAPARSAIEDRAQQDGGWDATGFLGPRIITVTGFVEQASRGDALAVLDRLAALSPHTLHEVVVDDPHIGPRSCLARVETSADPEWASPVSFRYSVTLKAPDPLRYGPPVTMSTTLASTSGTGRVWARVWPRDWGVTAGTTPGAATLPNTGTAGYFPAFRVDGPMPNPVITVNETGEWVRYGGTVLAGQWLEVDCGSRRVLLNGTVDVTYRVSSSATWPSVPPGGASVSIAADSADASASLTVFGYEGAWL